MQRALGPRNPRPGVRPRHDLEQIFAILRQPGDGARARRRQAVLTAARHRFGHAQLQVRRAEIHAGEAGDAVRPALVDRPGQDDAVRAGLGGQARQQPGGFGLGSPGGDTQRHKQRRTGSGRPPCGREPSASETERKGRRRPRRTAGMRAQAGAALRAWRKARPGPGNDSAAHGVSRVLARASAVGVPDAGRRNGSARNCQAEHHREH